jgi:hypothetical protein
LWGKKIGIHKYLKNVLFEVLKVNILFDSRPNLFCGTEKSVQKIGMSFSGIYRSNQKSKSHDLERKVVEK